MTILISFQGYANVTMDCTIVAFFSQARTQLQILRYNLEQLANLDVGDTDAYFKINAKKIYKQVYKDDVEGIMLHERLTRCVEHHKRIVW